MFAFLVSAAFFTSDLPPVPSLRVSHEAGTTKTEFTFDGGSSRDSETSGAKLEVRFDFDGDGKMDTFFSKTKTAKHIYEMPGVYTVRMDVLDEYGHVASTEKIVTVVTNTPPIPYFTVKPLSGNIATRFEFDTSGSSDAQYKDSALKYRFDFDGDSIFDTKFESRTRFNHHYETPGSFIIAMEIMDPEEATAQFFQIVNVVGNTPPIAAFTIQQKGFNTTFLFDANMSSDLETKPQKMLFRWDFDYQGVNDITFDTSFSLGAKRTARLIRPGPRMIRLQVKDEAGAIAEQIQPLNVPFFFLDMIFKPLGYDAPEILNVPMKKY